MDAATVASDGRIGSVELNVEFQFFAESRDLLEQVIIPAVGGFAFRCIADAVGDLHCQGKAVLAQLTEFGQLERRDAVVDGKVGEIDMSGETFADLQVILLLGLFCRTSGCLSFEVLRHVGLDAKEAASKNDGVEEHRFFQNLSRPRVGDADIAMVTVAVASVYLHRAFGTVVNRQFRHTRSDEILHLAFLPVSAAMIERAIGIGPENTDRSRIVVGFVAGREQVCVEDGYCLERHGYLPLSSWKRSASQVGV